MNGRPTTCPSEADETDGQARRRVEKPFQTRLILSSLTVRVFLAFANVALDSRDEGHPGNDVANTNAAESKANLRCAEAPSCVHNAERLDEHEDEGIGESGEERQHQDDGLRDEHLEGSNEVNCKFLAREALLERDNLLRAPYVFTGLPPPLGSAIHKNGGSGLRDKDQVNELDRAAKDELNPDRPAPAADILLDKTTNDGTQNGSSDRREDDVCNCVLLYVRLEEIGNHSQSDRATGTAETSEESTDHDAAEVGREGHGQLPDVDEEEGNLEHGLSTKKFRRAGCNFASEGVGDEEDHRATASCLQRDTELLGNAIQAVAVEGGVEVHRDLNPEDDSENGPLLPSRVAEGQVLVAIDLAENDPVCDGLDVGIVSRRSRRICSMRIVVLLLRGRRGRGSWRLWAGRLLGHLFGRRHIRRPKSCSTKGTLP